MKRKIVFKFPAEIFMIIVMFSAAYFFIKFIMNSGNVQKTFYTYNEFIMYELAFLVFLIVYNSFSIKKV